MKLLLATAAMALTIGAAPAFAQSPSGSSSGTAATSGNANSGNMAPPRDNRASKSNKDPERSKVSRGTAGSHDPAGYGVENHAAPNASTSALPSSSANTHRTTGASNDSASHY